MRRIFFVLALALACVTCFGQTQRYYCEIKGTEKFFTSGLKIVFDFGENKVYSFWGVLTSKQKLVDENGQVIPFNSMVDAGNYLSSKGWTFLQAYSSMYEDVCINHWIFYKDASSPEEAAEGIRVKQDEKKK